jgi:hypothetical protein
LKTCNPPTPPLGGVFWRGGVNWVLSAGGGGGVGVDTTGGAGEQEYGG